VYAEQLAGIGFSFGRGMLHVVAQANDSLQTARSACAGAESPDRFGAMSASLRDPGALAAEEAQLLARLRAGDEHAFEALVAQHFSTMLAVAQNYVKTRATAEEVVQEAWLGVLRGIDRFEGRSSLKTWILRILVNTAKTRGVREARSVPFASLLPEGDEPAVDADRFQGPSDPFAGHWRAAPADWRTLPAERLEGRETIDIALRAIEQLPPAQRTVITMRDVAGCDSDEVCALLDVSEGNQRVLLHRARAKVRAALEEHLDG
jgi:RNA polymerase sigma-70 factor (ECF subfamily)